MKRLLLAMAMLLAFPVLAAAQKTCTRVTSTSQNCLITATWQPSVVDATHDAPTSYVIQRKDGTGAMADIGTVAATIATFQNTFTDSGNVAHCWQAIAKNATGASVPSNQDCWTTPAINAAPPSVPGGFTISAISSQTLRITWDDTATESNYEVWGKSAKGQGRQFAKLSTLPMDTTTYDWTSLKRYTSFCAHVRALNDAGASNYSTTGCATTSK